MLRLAAAFSDACEAIISYKKDQAWLEFDSTLLEELHCVAETKACRTSATRWLNKVDVGQQHYLHLYSLVNNSIWKSTSPLGVPQ